MSEPVVPYNTIKRRRAIMKDAGELIEVLGFDPSNVRRIIVDIAVDNLIVIHTEQYVDKERFEVVKEALGDLSLKIIKVSDNG